MACLKYIEISNEVLTKECWATLYFNKQHYFVLVLIKEHIKFNS